jgi:hypothetical protein
MLQLYKKRKFSDLINDTFGFFRVAGKNYFKTYFAVNGGLLLILLVLIYIAGKVFFEGLFANFGTPASGRVLDEYFNSNLGFFIGTGVFLAVLIIIITLLSYSFPVIYLSIYEKKEKPETAEIVRQLKAKAGRILLFSLLWLVTFLPLLVLISLFSILLFAIIIGIPFALAIFGAVSCWMCLAFYDYLTTGNGYFTSMRKGFDMLFQSFWPHVGASVIMYIIVYVAQSIISFIPYIIGIGGLILNPTTGATQENFSFLGLMLLITFMLSITLGYILGNFIFINQGLIYYSAKEKKEHQSLHSDIDLIGKNFDSE